MRIKYLSISLALSLALGGILLVFWLRAENENNSNDPVNQPTTVNEGTESVDLDEGMSEQPARDDEQKHDDVNQLMDAWGDHILQEEGRSDHNVLLATLENLDLKYYGIDSIYFNGVPLGDASTELNTAYLEILLMEAGGEAKTPPDFIRPGIDGRDNLYIWHFMLCEYENRQ